MILEIGEWLFIFVMRKALKCQKHKVKTVLLCYVYMSFSRVLTFHLSYSRNDLGIAKLRTPLNKIRFVWASIPIYPKTVYLLTRWRRKRTLTKKNTDKS